jgi:hypothetical protein
MRSDETRTSRSPSLHALAVAAMIASVAVLSGTATAASLRGLAFPCGFVAKGAPWMFKGQKGTDYTVVALAGASCSAARKWIPRLTREHAAFALEPVPNGWHCSTTGGTTTGLTKADNARHSAAESSNGYPN